MPRLTPLTDGRIIGCYVYMLLCQDAGPIYVKVGMSIDPFKRLLHLRNGCPVTPRRFAFCGTPSRLLARRLEAGLLWEFSPWGAHGEWFKFEKDEKPDFNKGWATAFQKQRIRGYPYEWMQVPVSELVKEAAQRRAFSRHLWRSRGRAFQDFTRHGGVG